LTCWNCRRQERAFRCPRPLELCAGLLPLRSGAFSTQKIFWWPSVTGGEFSFAGETAGIYTCSGRHQVSGLVRSAIIGTEGVVTTMNKMPITHQQFWIAVESIHNWRADKINSFRFTGVTEFRSRAASAARKGDLVFIYVSSPRCAFSDLRRVMQDGLSRSLHSREYDIPCSRGLATEGVITLDEKEWAPVQKLIGKLSFIKASPGWGNAFLTSFRQISRADAMLIATAMREERPSSEWNAIFKEVKVATA
jgi:hypothetical protein